MHIKINYNDQANLDQQSYFKSSLQQQHPYFDANNIYQWQHQRDEIDAPSPIFSQTILSPPNLASTPLPPKFRADNSNHSRQLASVSAQSRLKHAQHVHHYPSSKLLHHNQPQEQPLKASDLGQQHRCVIY